MRRFDNYSSQRVNHFAESLLELAGLLERKALDRSAAASVNVFITGDDARCRRIKRFGREQRVGRNRSLCLSLCLSLSLQPSATRRRKRKSRQETSLEVWSGERERDFFETDCTLGTSVYGNVWSSFEKIFDGRIRVANHVESRLGRLKSGRNWLTIVRNEVMEKQLPLREPDLGNSRKWKVCERGKLSFWGKGRRGERSHSTINADLRAVKNWWSVCRSSVRLWQLSLLSTALCRQTRSHRYDPFWIFASEYFEIFGSSISRKLIFREIRDFFQNFSKEILFSNQYCALIVRG